MVNNKLPKKIKLIERMCGYEDVKNSILSNLPYGKRTKGWGLRLKEQLEFNLLRASRNKCYRDDVRSLRYIGESEYDLFLNRERKKFNIKNIISWRKRKK